MERPLGYRTKQAVEGRTKGNLAAPGEGVQASTSEQKFSRQLVLDGSTGNHKGSGTLCTFQAQGVLRTNSTSCSASIFQSWAHTGQIERSQHETSETTIKATKQTDLFGCLPDDIGRVI